MVEFVYPESLVSTQWLAAHLGELDIQVIDTTWFLPNVERSGTAEFEQSHIPGGQYWNLDQIADRNDPRPHMLPTTSEFEAHCARLGIGAKTRVVIYDRVSMMTVGRAWWMLRYFGHDAVSILDGGLAKWTAEDRPVEQGLGRQASATAPFTAAPRPHLVRSLEQVSASIGQPGEQILDARSAGRFAAAEPEPRPDCRGGHIPGSMNLPFNRLVDPETATIRSPEVLCGLFDDAGIDVAKPVVTTCGSGVTACLLAFGLHLLGHDRVAVYDGSWSEWGARADTPVEPAP